MTVLTPSILNSIRILQRAMMSRPGPARHDTVIRTQDRHGKAVTGPDQTSRARPEGSLDIRTRDPIPADRTTRVTSSM